MITLARRKKGIYVAREFVEYDRSGTQIVHAGSLIFCDSPDIVGWAIRAGQRLRWHSACEWNHVAIATETGTNPLVVQATIDGVTGDKTLSTLQGGKILIVPPPPIVDIGAVTAFAAQEVGNKYGWLTLFGVVIDQVLPRWFRFQIGSYGSWICSALVAECWRAGGWLTVWPDVYAVAPAQLALAVGVDESKVYKSHKQKEQ